VCKTRRKPFTSGCAAQQSAPNAALSRDEAEGSLQWRYEWNDEGAVLASSLRAEFATNVARGEAALDVALAALQVAAEDDALMSITGVPLPVEPYLQRLERLSDDLCACLSEAGGEAPQAVVDRADAFFYGAHRFRPPPAPALSAGAVVLDMPGVHSDPRHAYANNALTTKVALPPLLGILYADVWRRVQARGGVSFSIGMRLPATPWEAPQAVPLPHLTTLGAGVVNTWPAADALVQLLRHLKRCYWTHSWDTGLDDPEDGPYGSGGGFLGAAESLLGGAQRDAATTAIARTAAHRLARGIWTSSGGGDVRRARAACERLVLLLDQQRRHGDSRREAAYARERRDLGVLLLVSGDMAAALPHLEACAACAPAMAAMTADERGVLERLIQALPQLESAPTKPRRRGLPW
jgi:hypothetical protein